MKKYRVMFQDGTIETVSSKRKVDDLVKHHGGMALEDDTQTTGWKIARIKDALSMKELALEIDTALAARDQLLDSMQQTNQALIKKLEEEKAGAEILDNEGMAANDKIAVLARLVLNMALGTEKGLRAKHYAQYCVGERKDNPEYLG